MNSIYPVPRFLSKALAKVIMFMFWRRSKRNLTVSSRDCVLADQKNQLNNLRVDRCKKRQANTIYALVLDECVLYVLCFINVYELER